MKKTAIQLAIFFLAGVTIIFGINCKTDQVENQGANSPAESAAKVESHEHGPDCDHGDEAEVPDYNALLGVEDHRLANPDGGAELESTDSCSDHDHAAEGTHIALGETARANMGITMTTIKPEIYYDQIKIPGTLTADPDRLVEISAPAIVRVLNLSATPPSVVKPGQRLAILELADPEVRNLQMDAVTKRADLLAATLELNRTNRYLQSLQEGSALASEIERVSADMQIAEAHVQAIESALTALIASLKVAGLSEAQLTSLKDQGKVTTQIEIFAPDRPHSQSMEVADRPVSLGETVDAGSTLFSLVALDELRVIGEAFEADVPIVRQAMRRGLPVELLFTAENEQIKGLQIQSLEGALDGVNRVTHFFIRLSNELLSEWTENNLLFEERRYRAGSRVQIMVATQEIGQRFVVPSSAIIHESGEAYGFVLKADGFERVALAPESIDGRMAILSVNGHLHENDELVVKGTLQLNLLWHEQNSGGVQAVDPHAGHSH